MRNALFILLISSAFTLGACSSAQKKHDCGCNSKGHHAHHEHKEGHDCKDGACDMKKDKEQK